VKWLGRVPEHWAVSPLKYVVTFRSGGTPSKDKLEFWDGDIPWASAKDLKKEQLEDTQDHLTELAVTSGAASLVPAGSVLVVVRGMILARIFPVAEAMVPMAINQDLKALYASSKLDGRFLAHLLRGLADESLRRLEEAGHGTKALRMEAWTSMQLTVPPREEQCAILSHLDRETTRIDGLVEKKTRFIELLREKRRALITHAVTKGLDPNVKMRNSGVEWLGEVPEHWGVKQLKHVVDPNSSITYGIVQAGPEFEGGVPYIRTSDMSAEELPTTGYPLTSPEIDDSYARSRVRPGDIVISIRASVGKCLPVPAGLSVANLTQGTAKISPGKGVARNFLLTFLNSSAAQIYFDLMAKGATFKEITIDALRRTPVLVPPQAEQAEINQFIARHVGRLDQLCRLSEQSIAMLKERRSALITAAVTGQIDLREAV
jgi:type I restriction enzyme S subunit